MRAGIPLFVLCSVLPLLGCVQQYQEPADVFQATTIGRTLQCTSQSADGTCNAKKCTKSKEGMAEYGVPEDCASYAGACIDAGHKWTGTKEGGTCERVKK